MQFNYIETMVTTNEYSVGINDNSPEKFRCDNIVINVNRLSNQSTRSMMQSYAQFAPLDIMSSLDDEDAYDVEFVPRDMDIDISLEKMDKVEKGKIDYMTSISSAVKYAQNMMQIANTKDTEAQGWMMAFQILQMGFNIWMLTETIKNNRENYDTVKDSVDSQIEDLNERIESNQKFVAETKERLNKSKGNYAIIS